MEQLKLGDIIELVEELLKDIPADEVLNLPVYIGKDDELNGIHCAWYRQLVSAENEDDADLIELINEDSHNIEFSGNAILIS